MTKREDGGEPVLPPEKPVKKKTDYSKVEFRRGMAIALNGAPHLVTRVPKEDTFTESSSTVYLSVIEATGGLGHEHHRPAWELRRMLTEGEATLIDGTRVRTMVDLPPAWSAQVVEADRRSAEAKQARVAAGKDPLDAVEPMNHPAYGVATLTRSSGGHGYLFGSAFKHQHQIRLTVHRATLHRSLSNDRPHAREELLEIAMSEAQFAHFITSAGLGEGTPCTLSHVFGQMMPQPPPPAETEKFHADARRTIEQAGAKVGAAVAEAKRLLEKDGAITKGERKALVDLLWNVERAFNDSLPFTIEQFGERMEKIVSAGKHEIDAYLTRCAERAGLQAPVTLTLGEEVKLLTEEAVPYLCHACDDKAGPDGYCDIHRVTP